MSKYNTFQGLSWWKYQKFVEILEKFIESRLWQICKCDVLHPLVPFVQFKKREKHPWRSVTLSKVTKSNTPPWVKKREKLTFFKLYQWYQIAQSISNVFVTLNRTDFPNWSRVSIVGFQTFNKLKPAGEVFNPFYFNITFLYPLIYSFLTFSGV